MPEEDDGLVVGVVEVKVIILETLPPLTTIEPDNVETEYPDTVPIVYEYVPFGSENVMVFVVEDSVVPLRVTDHDVPDGRPDSVNVTLYSGVNVTETVAPVPLTGTGDVYEDSVYDTTGDAVPRPYCIVNA